MEVQILTDLTVGQLIEYKRNDREPCCCGAGEGVPAGGARAGGSHGAANRRRPERSCANAAISGE